MKISGKIIILVLILVAVSILTGFLGLWSLNSVNQNVESLYLNRVEPLRELKNVSDAYAIQIVDVSQKTETGLMTRAEALKELEEATQIVSENWEAYTQNQLSPEEEQLANEAVELRKTSKAAYYDLVNIMKMPDEYEAMQALKDFNEHQLYQAIDPYTAKISELVDLQIRESEKLYTSSDEQFTQTRQLVIIVLGIGLLAGIIIAVLIILNITGILKKIRKEIQELAKNATAGKLSSRANAKIINSEFRYIPEGFNDVLDAVIGPLNVAAEYVDRISKGNLPPKITDTYNGDFNEIKNNLNQCIDAVHLLIDDAENLTQEAAKGNFDARSDVNIHQGDFRKIVSGVNQTLDVVVDKVFWYEQMLDSIPFPISVTDMDMNWTFFNKPAEQVTGLSRKEMLGKQCSNWGADICETENCGIQLLRKGTLVSNFKQPGLDKNFQVDTAYLKDANGNSIGHIEIVQDITKQERKAEYTATEVKRLAENLQRLSQGNLNFDTNVEQADQYTQKEHKNFSLINENLIVAQQAVKTLIDDTNMLVSSAVEGKLATRADASKHEGDFRKIVQGVNDTLDAVINPLNVAAEYIDRISKGNLPPKITDSYNGDFNEIKNNLNALISAIAGLITEVNNIADAAIIGNYNYRADNSSQEGNYKEMTDGLNLVIDAFSKALDSIQTPIMIIDNDFNIRYMNEFGAKTVGKDKNRLVNDKCYRHFKTGDCNTEKCALARAMASGHAVESETQANPNGKQLEINYTGAPVKDRNGNTVGAIEIVMDQTAVKNTLKKAEKLNLYQKEEVRKVSKLLSDISVGKPNISYAVEHYDDDTKETAEAFKAIGQALHNLRDATLEIIGNTKRIAQGDLSVDMRKRSDQDELIESLNSMVSAISDTVEEITIAADNVAKGSEQISNSSNMIASGSNEQASSTEEVSSSMEEMAANIEQNTENAKKTEQISTKAATDIETSSKLVTETVDAMKTIAEKISIITDIAERTDLLAINAAIEAARAGEHGEGFAVVAAEVRKLAEQSQHAAKEINELSSKSVRIAENTGNQLTAVVPDIKETALLVKNIANASLEQGANANHVNNAMQQLSDVIQQNSSNAEELSTGAEELNSQAEQMRETVGFFKIKQSKNKLFNKKASHSDLYNRDEIDLDD